MTVHPRPNITRAAEGLDRRRFTVAEVEAMVDAGVMRDDERIELIGGELVPMSPKGIRHEVLKAELNRLWSRKIPESCSLIPETTFRLSEDTYLEPDFVVYDRSTRLSGITGRNVHLVVEIADSSLRYDTGRKAALYAAFGIRELWVIDVIRLVTYIFRAPGANGYGQTHEVAADAIAMPLLAPADFALRLDDLDLT